MALIEGGEIGFDEGGVLKALSEPVVTRTVVDFTRNRKGEVISQATSVYNVSMTTVLALLVLYYGPGILAMFKTSILDSDASDAARAWIDGIMDFLLPGLPGGNGEQIIEQMAKSPAFIYYQQLIAQGYTKAQARKMALARYQ